MKQHRASGDAKGTVAEFDFHRGRWFRRRRRLRLLFEQLEPRRLLAAGGWDYDQVSPQWFKTVVAPEQAVTLANSLHATGSGIHDTTFSNNPNQRRWIVRFAEDVLRERQIEGVGQTEPLLDLDVGNVDFTVIRGLGLPGQVEVETIEPNQSTVELALQSNPNVVSFILDSLVVSQSLPSDELIDRQWALDNTGVDSSGNPDGIAGADIGAADAYTITTGRRDVIVSVVDSGIDYAHPDLYLNVWINPGEIPESIAARIVDADRDGIISFVDLNHPANAVLTADVNANGFVDAADLIAISELDAIAVPVWLDGADTDGNGFVDDLFGYDFHNNDPDPLDDSGHGTHVSGTIAAIGNNGIGVAGVSYNTTVMPLKFLSGSDLGATANATRALNYATMMRTKYGQGVRVINNSWGGQVFNRGLRDAIDASAAADILVVAGAGNGDPDRNGIDIDVEGAEFYPASYDANNIIAVSASGLSDELAPFANYGSRSVDLAAPGFSILSTLPGGDYGFRHGTSMATAFVSGTAALKFADVPYATYQEVRDAVLSSVDLLPAVGERSKLATGGRLNAHQTLLLDTVAPRVSVSLNQESAFQGTEPTRITVQITDDVAVDRSTIFSDAAPDENDFDFFLTRQDDPSFKLPLTATSVSTEEDAAMVAVQYELLAPGGSWNLADQGTYQLQVQPGGITDTSGNVATDLQLRSVEFEEELPFEITTRVEQWVADIELADLNGDGFPDLVAAVTDDSDDASSFEGLRIRLNEAGQFSSRVIEIPLPGAIALAVGDLNRNRLADVVVVRSDSPSAELLFDFDGSGFSDQRIISFGDEISSESLPFIPIDVVLGDFNDDLSLDAAFSLHSNRIAIAENDGEGGFQDVSFFETSSRNIDEEVSLDDEHLFGPGGTELPEEYDRWIATGHFNADSLLDLAVVSLEPYFGTFFSDDTSPQDHLVILANQGDGSFARQQVINADRFEDDLLFIEDLTAGDLTGDGIDDLVVTGEFGELFLAITITDDAGQESIPLPDLEAGSDVYRSEIVDLDGDGDLDLIRDVTDSNFDTDVQWLENDGNGDFTPRIAVSGKSSEYLIGDLSFGSIRSADFDQNGLDDILTLDILEAFPIKNETRVVSDETFLVEPGPLEVDTTDDRLATEGSTGLSLRQAVADANTYAGLDEIVLPEGIYEFGFAAELEIQDDLIIRGQGAEFTIIDANGLARVLHVFPNVTLTLSDVTIRGGDHVDVGGILNEGNLNASRVVVTENRGTGTGGIRNRGGGGAEITDSTISANTAEVFAGGITNQGGNLKLINSTVSSNVGGLTGGVLALSGSTLITQSTIVFNQETTNRGYAAGVQAGSSGGVLQLGNTLIAGNITVRNITLQAEDLGGDVQSLGNNLVGILGDDSGLQDGVNGDLAGTRSNPIEPLLGPLDDNGGPTPTHALLAGSPAIDRGGGTSLLPFDQRGSARVLDGNGDGTLQVDIGALEYSSFSVTSTDDSVDADPDDQIGVDVDGKRTFRAAVQQANTTSGADTITLAAATYTFTLAGASEDLGASGDLDVTDDLTIVGLGPELTTVDAAELDRVFDVHPGASLVLRDLAIRGGLTREDPDSRDQVGGGIRNAGELTLINVHVMDNRAEDGGGGLANLAEANAKVTRSRLEANSAFGSIDSGGGAIRNEGSLEVDATSLLGNDSATRGGAVLSFGTARVAASTIADNSADRGGGWFQAAGRSTIQISTISRNTATDSVSSSGGGLYQAAGTVTIVASTIAENVASDLGGGILSDSGTIRVGSSLIARNAANIGGDASGSFQSLGNNLVGQGASTTGFIDGVNGDLVGILDSQLQLGSLQDNGGPTMTHQLLAGSPAIDAGNPGQTRDQRNAPRPVSDIGAVEFSPRTVFVRDTTDGADPPATGCIDGGCTLRTAVLEGNTTSEEFTIVLEPGSYLLSLKGADEDDGFSGDLDVLGTIRLIGAGAGQTRIDAGGIDRAIHVKGSLAVSDLTITRGDTSEASDTKDGGGILNEGELVIEQVIVTENRSAGDGGGIASGPGSTLEIHQSVISENQATNGGGVSSQHESEITRTSLVNNVASQLGGGVFVTGASARIDRTTIAYNQATTGGGVYGTADLASPLIEMTNATLSSNRATNRIGAAAISGGRMQMDSVTVYANSAGDVGGIDASIALPLGVQLRNSIIAGNRSLASITDGVGEFDSLGNNLFGNVGAGDSPYATGFVTSDLAGTSSDPIAPAVAALRPRDAEPGVTPTHALAPSSPAIDQGATDLTVDQRGLPRPLDEGTDGNTKPDIGAFELVIDQQAPEAALGELGQFISPGSAAHLIEIVYTDDSPIDRLTIDDDKISVVTPKLNRVGKTVVLSARVKEVSDETGTGQTRVTYKVLAPEGSWDASDDGEYTIVVQAGQVADIHGNPIDELNIPFQVDLAGTDYPSVGAISIATSTDPLPPNGTATFTFSDLQLNDFSVNPFLEVYLDRNRDGVIDRDIDGFLASVSVDGLDSHTLAFAGEDLVNLQGSRQVSLLAAIRGTDVDLGAVDVLGPTVSRSLTVIETDGPMGVLNAADLISLANDTEYQFSVTYTDETAVDVSSLGDGDLRIDGPNGFQIQAQYVGVEAAGNASRRIATYRIVPQGDVFLPEDTGFYSVTLLENQVADVNGIGSDERLLGGFSIDFVAPANVSGTLSGMVFEDEDGDGIQGSGNNLAGVTVFLDLNHNGRFDAGQEPFSATAADGSYAISYAQIPSGRYAVLLDTDREITSPTEIDFSTQRISQSTQELAISLAVGQFNADAAPDVAVADYNNGTISIRPNDGAGVFSQVETTLGDLRGPFALRSINADNESGDDLVVTDLGTGQVVTLINDGNGHYPDRQNMQLPSADLGNASPTALEVGDLDGDGDSDVIVAIRENAAVILLNRGLSRAEVAAGAPIFADPMLLELPEHTLPLAFAIGHVDQDGRPDLVVATSVVPSAPAGSPGLTIYFAASTLPDSIDSPADLFSETRHFELPATPRSVVVGDLEGSSLADIAVVQSAGRSGKVSILRNLGNRSFQIRSDAIEANTVVRSLAAADLDGDQRIELVASTLNTHSLAVFSRARSDLFDDEQYFPVGQLPFSFQFTVATSDVDLDSKPDLLVSDANGVSILRNARFGHVVDLIANRPLPNLDFGTREATEFDFGDAPGAGQIGMDSGYPTLRSVDGARHAVGDLFLGSGVSAESDGRPDPQALGDDNDDGVRLRISPIASRDNATLASVSITVSRDSRIDAWIDFNQDGDWNDASEQVLLSQQLMAGRNILPISIPAGALAGETFARFRSSTLGGLSPVGLAEDGEVEDYAITILDATAPQPIEVNRGDFDALRLQISASHAAIFDAGVKVFEAAVNELAGLVVRGLASETELQVDWRLLPLLGIIDLDPVDGHRLELGTTGQLLDLTAAADDALRGISVIDLSGEGNHDLVISGSEISNLSPSGRLRVIYDADDSVDVDAGFRFDRVDLEGGRLIHTFVHDDAVAVFDGPWDYSNPVDRYDVNQEHGATAADALAVINELQYRRFSDPVTQSVKDPANVDLTLFRFYDVSREDKITARDALLIINELARIPREGEGAGAEQLSFPQVAEAGESRKDDRLTPFGSIEIASGVMPTTRVEAPFWIDASTLRPRGLAASRQQDAPDPTRLDAESIDAVLRLADFAFV